jgi:hypothetical protein
MLEEKEADILVEEVAPDTLVEEDNVCTQIAVDGGMHGKEEEEEDLHILLGGKGNAYLLDKEGMKEEEWE